MHEIDILRNNHKIIWGVLRAAFGRPKRHPDALLVKTMTAGEYDLILIIPRFISINQISHYFHFQF